MATWQETVGQQWDTFVQQTWDSALDFLTINFAVSIGHTIAVESTVERSVGFLSSIGLQLEEAMVFVEANSFDFQTILGFDKILEIPFSIQYDVELGITEVHNIEYDLVLSFDVELSLVISDANLFFNTLVYTAEFELTGTEEKNLNEQVGFRFDVNLIQDDDVIFRDVVNFDNRLDFIPGTPNWYREEPVIADTWFDEEEA